MFSSHVLTRETDAKLDVFRGVTGIPGMHFGNVDRSSHLFQIRSAQPDSAVDYG
jgi:hypothetical protein